MSYMFITPYYTANMVNESCKKQFVHPAPLYTAQDVHLSCKKLYNPRDICAKIRYNRRRTRRYRHSSITAAKRPLGLGQSAPLSPLPSPAAPWYPVMLSLKSVEWSADARHPAENLPPHSVVCTHTHTQRPVPIWPILCWWDVKPSSSSSSLNF